MRAQSSQGRESDWGLAKSGEREGDGGSVKPRESKRVMWAQPRKRARERERAKRNQLATLFTNQHGRLIS